MGANIVIKLRFLTYVLAHSPGMLLGPSLNPSVVLDGFLNISRFIHPTSVIAKSLCIHSLP